MSLVNFIPVMTGASSPSGVASANSEYAGNPAWHAFGGSFNGWLDAGGGFPAYLQYEFPSATVIQGYGINPWNVDSFPIRCPKNWMFQASNNGTSWTTLDTVTGYTSWASSVVSTFTISNTTAYKYYRISITANVGDTYNAIRAVSMLSESPVHGPFAITESPDQMIASALNNNIHNVAIANSNENADRMFSLLWIKSIGQINSVINVPSGFFSGVAEGINTLNGIVVVNGSITGAGSIDGSIAVNGSAVGVTGSSGVIIEVIQVIGSAFGTTGSSGSISSIVNTPTGSMLGAGFLRSSISTPNGSILGVTGSSGFIRSRIAAPDGYARGTSSSGSYINAKIPVPSGFMGTTGFFGLVKTPTGSARGRTLLNFRMIDGVPVELFPHDVWSLNLRHRDGSDPEKTPIAEVTQWKNFPMKQILRFGNDYYGLGMNGNLYKLGGKTDDGSPIDWSIKTAMTDFDMIQFKAPNSVYLGGRVERGFTVKISADEDSGDLYSYPSSRGTGPNTARARIAKGYKARYYGFGISNSNGAVDIQTINVELKTSERS